MRNEEVLQDNVFEKQAPAVNAIAHPVIEDFALTHFALFRFYWDRSFIALTNTPEWPEYFLRHQLYQYMEGSPNFLTINSLFKPAPFFIDDYDKNTPYGQKIIRTMEEQFNYWHLTYFVKHTIGYSDFMVFAVEKEHDEFKHEFLAQEGYFIDFFDYFKDKAHKLIKEAEIFRYKNPKLSESSFIVNKYQSRRKNIRFPINRYYGDGKYKNIYVTRREMDCLCLLKDGFNYKEIAIQLSVTRKTVQALLDNVRQKLSFADKKSLQKFLHKEGVSHLSVARHREESETSNDDSLYSLLNEYYRSGYCNWKIPINNTNDNDQKRIPFAEWVEKVNQYRQR